MAFKLLKLVFWITFAFGMSWLGHHWNAWGFQGY